MGKFDVIVVGMGPSAIFLAYELVKQGKKILSNRENRKMY